MTIIGSARIDERGKASGGTPGDQKQTGTPDRKGEVSLQDFYVSPKGWVILRPKSVAYATGIAEAMLKACSNPMVGYDQARRLDILTDGIGSRIPTSCDCSSLVRACVREGTGKDPGNFTTANEAAKLMATGLFTQITYQPGTPLKTGDILATKTKGHTVVVVDGDPDKSIQELALEVLAGKWGNGMDRKNRLHAAGYDYAAVQAEVNRILQAEKPAQHISDRGLKLIQKYEGCRLKAYHLAGETYYTIGWGHHGPDVLPNMTISQEAADELLRMDLVRYEAYVKHCVTDITLTQCRLDALVSYCYNRGPGKLKDELAANCHTVQEYSAGIVKYWGSAVRYKDALLKRRREEQALFNGN